MQNGAKRRQSVAERQQNAGGLEGHPTESHLNELQVCNPPIVADLRTTTPKSMQKLGAAMEGPRTGLMLRERTAGGAGCLRTQQNDPKFTQNIAKRPQIDAERRKTIPNHCRTPQNDPKLMPSAAKRPPINAERSKTTPKSLQNAAKRSQIEAERSLSRE